MQTNVAKIKRTDNIKTWQGYGTIEVSYPAWQGPKVEIGIISENR